GANDFMKKMTHKTEGAAAVACSALVRLKNMENHTIPWDKISLPQSVKDQFEQVRLERERCAGIRGMPHRLHLLLCHIAEMPYRVRRRCQTLPLRVLRAPNVELK